MLKTTPSNLYEEILAAERHLNKHLEYYDDIVKKYAGSAMGSGDTDEMLTENHIYEYLSLTIPRLIHDNPRVSINTRRPATQGETAKALQHGVNRWVRDSNVRHVLMRMAYDMLFSRHSSQCLDMTQTQRIDHISLAAIELVQRDLFVTRLPLVLLRLGSWVTHGYETKTI